MEEKIRVLIVDDSSFIRTALKSIINSAENLIVIGEAKNGKEAVDLALSLNPDVITMDVEMPVMNGIEATKLINKQLKVPIIMLSTLTSLGADATLDALTYGAVDFITKKSTAGEFKQLKQEIVDKIEDIYNSSNLRNILHRNSLLKENRKVNIEEKEEERKIDAEKSGVIPRRTLTHLEEYTLAKGKKDSIYAEKLQAKKEEILGKHTSEKQSRIQEVEQHRDLHKKEVSEQDPKPSVHPAKTTRIGLVNLSYERADVCTAKDYIKPIASNVKCIFIGISTGGPAALQKVVPSFSSKVNVPIFIVQHMPPNFTKSLANRLDGMSHLYIKEAENGEPITPGTVYIGKGGAQMLVNHKGQVVLDEGKYEGNLFSPSVEITLDSLITLYGNKILAIMMTGMGSDGKNAFKKLKDKGGFAIVQDFGIPATIQESKS